MVEEQRLITEVAGLPKPKVPMNEAQKTRLQLWDEVQFPKLCEDMQKDREYRVKHKEWEYRQFTT